MQFTLIKVLFSLLLVVFKTVKANDEHALLEGKATKDSITLFHCCLKVKCKKGGKQVKEIRFNTYEERDEDIVIDCIQVDNLEDGGGGTAKIVEGGVGKNCAKIKLTSKKGQCLHMCVTISGHRKKEKCKSYTVEDEDDYEESRRINLVAAYRKRFKARLKRSSSMEENNEEPTQFYDY